ncbi:HpcH/HpaI aldolase/citrate lyase family protein [Lacisediminihabitans profunda]|uniref:CoA ester lyase n=1 Tax=Lacisediminihabitans profunda TaxID=2594790 RepID=A0A5C8UT89_9MICO|nr:aldolase/citrate lyase family protein [Lacisediminihabitans profunda]TXN31502.1 CoA ester lyase [Lacisediminihabitans profunda]
MTRALGGQAGTTERVVPARLARSWHLVSALRLDEAHGSLADSIVIDLEDAVPAAQKPGAREAAAGWLATGSAWVRVNDATSGEWRADLAAVCRVACLRGVMLAKVETPEQIEATAAGLPAGTRIVALIESARGLEAAADIARSAGTFRLAFGSGDFRRDTGVGDDPLALAYARSRLVVASAAAGIPGAIDGPTITESPDALTAAARHTRTMGLTGKLTLRGDHAALINDALSPSADEREWAAGLLGSAPSRDARDGSYLPMLARARSIVALASAFGPLAS